MGEAGVPYMLELGARAGGNMIPVQLSDASGIDLVAANVLCAMGEDPGDISWDSANVEGGWATYVLHSGSEGVFQGVEVANELRACVYREVPYAAPGESVARFDGANRALGIEFLKFENAAQMASLLFKTPELVRPVVGKC